MSSSKTSRRTPLDPLCSLCRKSPRRSKLHRDCKECHRSETRKRREEEKALVAKLQRKIKRLEAKLRAQK